VRLPLTISGPVLVVGALLLGGCAGAAPPLPVDTTGTTSTQHASLADFTAADAALSCPQIVAEHSGLKAQMDQANANVQANRQRNQIAGFIAVTVTPLAYIATEGNDADKAAIKAAYARQDVLEKLAMLKGCSF
jgi:hypothetical protein